MRTAAIAGLALAWMSSPAQAQDVARVGLGSTLGELIAAPDGGAWIGIDRGRGDSAIGRAKPEGAFTTTRVSGNVGHGTLGPDGLAWFTTGGRALLRVGTDGAVARVPTTRYVAGPLATGADGAFWSQVDLGLARVSTEGKVTRLPDDAEACESGLVVAMERASDGAMWIAENGCERVMRITSAGTTRVSMPGVDVTELAADAAGGVWFAGDGGEIGQVSATGTVTRDDVRAGAALDIAVAPDGGAWLATGSCRLARISPSGELTTVPAPVPATQLAFAPDGRLWAASGVRLVRLQPGAPVGACDDRPPAVRILPGTRRISLAALRRSVLRIAVREPAIIAATASFSSGTGGLDAGTLAARVVRDRRGGTGRLAIAAGALRRLERGLKAGQRWTLRVTAVGIDAEGNFGAETRTLRVTR